MPQIDIGLRDHIGRAEGCRVRRPHRQQRNRPARHRHQRVRHRHADQRRRAGIRHREAIGRRVARVAQAIRVGVGNRDQTLFQHNPRAGRNQRHRRVVRRVGIRAARPVRGFRRGRGRHRAAIGVGAGVRSVGRRHRVAAAIQNGRARAGHRIARRRGRVLHIAAVDVRLHQHISRGEGGAVGRADRQCNRPARHCHQGVRHRHPRQRHVAGIRHRKGIIRRVSRPNLPVSRGIHNRDQPLDQIDPRVRPQQQRGRVVRRISIRAARTVRRLRRRRSPHRRPIRRRPGVRDVGDRDGIAAVIQQGRAVGGDRVTINRGGVVQITAVHIGLCDHIAGCEGGAVRSPDGQRNGAARHGNQRVGHDHVCQRGRAGVGDHKAVGRGIARIAQPIAIGVGDTGQ